MSLYDKLVHGIKPVISRLVVCVDEERKNDNLIEEQDTKSRSIDVRSNELSVRESKRGSNINIDKKVYILLPTFNRSGNIGSVIQQIKKQTYWNWKLVIIDDGSDIKEYEKTFELINNINDERITLRRNEKNMGLPATLNRGLTDFLESGCDYFTWISDDNVIYTNYIMSLVSNCNGFAYTAFDFVDETIKKSSIVNVNYKNIDEIINGFCGMASFMWTRETILKVGYYNEECRGCEDYDYLLRTFISGCDINYTDTITMKYILSKESMYYKNKEKIREMTKMINKKYEQKEINTIVYYSRTPYKTLLQRPQQIMRFFDKNYRKIFIGDDKYLYEDKWKLAVIPYNDKDIKNILKDMKNLTIYYTDSRLVNEVNNIKNGTNCNIIYDLIDAPIDEFAVWKDKLSDAVKSADYVIYSHPKLIEYLNEVDNNREYHYVSNGCDYEHFSKAKERIYPRPNDLPETKKQILGYYGAFAEWLDYDLIRKYADDGKYHIVMIGGIPNNKKYNIRLEHENITWLDHKDYDDLPRYLSWFDVCFLPFKKCKLTEYVNPCKYWEYRASGKEIVGYWSKDIEDEKLTKYNEICKTISELRMPMNRMIKKYNITQLMTSKSLEHLHNRFKKKYNLKDRINKNENTVYFGIYSQNDLDTIRNSKIKYIIFGGTDVDMILGNSKLKKVFDEINNRTIISISRNIGERLRSYGYDYLNVNLDLVDKDIFKKPDKLGDKIFIYNGITKGNEQLYGKEIYDKVIQILPEYEYIFSNELNNMPIESMPNIYSQCFIGLRLTDKDGNANMVQEMTTMGIPVIHNGEQGGISWGNLEDIVNVIRNYSKYTLITGDIDLDKVDGCTIWWSNTINEISKRKRVIYISNYPIETENNLRNLENVNNVIIINPKVKLNGREVKLKIEELCAKYNINEIIIRSNELLEEVNKDWDLLKITKIYSLELHFQNVIKLQNKFDKLICQSDKLREYYNEGGVFNEKITVIPPKCNKYNFTINREDNKIRLIYAGTLRDEENIIEIIDDFLRIKKSIPEMELTICYGKIHGTREYIQKINSIKEKNIESIKWKYNLSHKECCEEIANSTHGISWRKRGYGNNGMEISTKEKEYSLYGLKIIKSSLSNYIVKEYLEGPIIHMANPTQMISLKINKFANDNEILILKIYNKYGEDKKININIDDKLVPGSEIMLNNKWITINFIDPKMYNSLEKINICPAWDIEKLEMQRITRNSIVYNYNISRAIVPDIDTINNKPKIKIAVVADAFTYNNVKLDFECKYIPNDENLLDINTEEYDILFCESCWHGIDGSWKYEFNLYGKNNYGKKLDILVNKFKSQNKKTIFYNKEDPFGFDKFLNSAMIFDIIITTDNKCVDKYKSYDKNKKVYAFPFTINPIVHNPCNKKINKKLVAFPGSFYNNFENRVDSMTRNLEKIINITEIDIYDRQYILNKLIKQVEHLGIHKNKYMFPEQFNKYINPCLTPEQVNSLVYNGYKFVVNFNTISDSDTMCSRRAIELAGCGTNIISDKSKALENIYGNDILFFDDIKSINDLDRFDNINLNLYHKTHLNYTFKKMMKYVLNEINIKIENEKILIIKNTNTKLSYEVYNAYLVIMVDEYEKNINKYKDYHLLYILNETNFYDLEYVEKMILPLNYSNRNIYITNNKEDWFKYNSDDYIKDIYLLNKYQKNNEKIFINNNLSHLYTDVFDYKNYLKFDLNHKITTEDSNNEIHVIMCQWKRINKLPLTIENMANQTVKNIHLYIWNNNYNEKKILESIIINNDHKLNISWHNSVENIGGIGRFILTKKLIESGKNIDKVIFIDDDQIFEPKLIETMLKMHNKECGYHWYGKKFYKNKSYWDAWQNLHSSNSVNHDLLDYGGTGTMIIDSKLFSHPDFFYFNNKYKFIEDLWMSYFALEKCKFKLKNGKEIRFLVSSNPSLSNDENAQWKQMKEIKTNFLNVLRNDGKWNV